MRPLIGRLSDSPRRTRRDGTETSPSRKLAGGTLSNNQVHRLNPPLGHPASIEKNGASRTGVRQILGEWPLRHTSPGHRRGRPCGVPVPVNARVWPGTGDHKGRPYEAVNIPASSPHRRFRTGSSGWDCGWNVVTSCVGGDRRTPRPHDRVRRPRRSPMRIVLLGVERRAPYRRG